MDDSMKTDITVRVLLEDYRQRFEETQNNLKVRNTLVGVAVGTFGTLLTYGLKTGDPTIIYLSPFLLLAGISLYLAILEANVRIARHMIQIEEKINNLLNCEHSELSGKGSMDDRDILHWMHRHSVIGIKDGEDRIPKQKERKEGIFRELWLWVMVVIILFVVFLYLSWFLRALSLARIFEALLDSFSKNLYFLIIAIIPYLVAICMLHNKYKKVRHYCKGYSKKDAIEKTSELQNQHEGSKKD